MDQNPGAAVLSVVLCLCSAGISPLATGIERYARTGDTVVLPCREASVGFRESIQWSYNTASGTRSTLFTLQSSGTIITGVTKLKDRKQIVRSSSLRIQELKKDDFGTYTCDVCVNKGLHCTTVSQISLLLSKDHVTGWPSGDVTDQEVTTHRQVTALDPNTTEIVYVAEGEFVQLPCVGISNRTEGRHVEWSFQAIGDQSRTLLNVSAPAYPRVNPRETVSLLPNASLLNVSAPAYPTVNPRERVSLLPNASLLIQGVQSPDTGTYHCRRDEQEKYHMLTVCVLTVKADVSSPVSKGTEVTVSCSLLCDHTPEDAVLQWMDSNGTLLESNTTLSTGSSAELVIPSAYNTTLSCLLQVKGQARASVEYTIPIHETEQQGSTETVLLPVLLGVVAVCVVIAAILILLLRGRRTGDKENDVVGVQLNSTHSASQVHEEEDEVNYAAVEIRQPASTKRREMIQDEGIYCLIQKINFEE
ncbi:uncharacterized protein LOC117964018 isoform X2 [Acipenser ruthenus]|uniref:uncharacterized protein LOC117964018 isoform X2 n=1 Tax=Acipenser ruthenus TaxID=7906 RepID=UPI0027426A67|nr:uncharacterized protein LOC117964018 isoform X2 [Acipenser ruthenus]